MCLFSNLNGGVWISQPFWLKKIQLSFKDTLNYSNRIMITSLWNYLSPLQGPKFNWNMGSIESNMYYIFEKVGIRDFINMLIWSQWGPHLTS